MAKFIMNNCIINAKNGGTVKNYEHVEITDTELNFTEDAINILIDEHVAIINNIIESGYKDDLVEIIQALKTAESGDQEKILTSHNLFKFLKEIGSISKIIAVLFEFFK